MTKPQLVKSDGSQATFFNSSANTVKSETINRDCFLFHIGIPLTNIKENLSLRTPFKIIDISGVYRGTESEMNDFIDEMEDIASVNQTDSVYTNALNRTVQVKINNFTFVTSQNTNKVGYTIRFYDETI